MSGPRGSILQTAPSGLGQVSEFQGMGPEEAAALKEALARSVEEAKRVADDRPLPGVVQNAPPVKSSREIDARKALEEARQFALAFKLQSEEQKNVLDTMALRRIERRLNAEGYQPTAVAGPAVVIPPPKKATKLSSFTKFFKKKKKGISVPDYDPDQAYPINNYRFPDQPGISGLPVMSTYQGGGGGADMMETEVDDLVRRRAKVLSATERDMAAQGEAQAVAQAQEESQVSFAIQESVLQAEYDEILRDAKLLRRDLEAALVKCRALRAGFRQHHAKLDLEQRKLSLRSQEGTGRASGYAFQALMANSREDMEQANERVVALKEAVEELQSLEDFIRGTRPKQQEAKELVEEVLRALMEKLNFMGFHFGKPEGPPTTSSGLNAEEVESQVMVKYRNLYPNSPNIKRKAAGASSSILDTSPVARAPSPSVSEAEPSVPAPAAVPSPSPSPLSPPPPPAPAPEAPMTPDRETSPGPTPRSLRLDNAMPAADEPPTAPAVAAAPAAPPSLPPVTPIRRPAPSGRTGGSARGTPATRSASTPLPAAAPAADGGGQSTPPSQMDIARSLISSASAGSTQGRSASRLVKPTASSSAKRVERPFVTPRLTADRIAGLNGDLKENRGTPDNMRRRTVMESLEMDSVTDFSEASTPIRRGGFGALRRLGSLLTTHSGISTDRFDSSVVKRSATVVHLFTEVQDSLADNIMDRSYVNEALDSYDAISFSGSELVDSRVAQNGASSEQAAAASGETEAGAVRGGNAEKLGKLATAAAGFKAKTMPEVVAFVRETDRQLAEIAPAGLDPVTRLQVSWPERRYSAMRDAAALHTELMYHQTKMKGWRLPKAAGVEEFRRMEVYLDKLRERMIKLLSERDATQMLFEAERLPWDGSIFRTTRQACLNMAELYMQRVLFEVNNLERDVALQHERCMQHLANCVRFAYKAHQFAGGFNADCNEQFEKVKRLATHYMRQLDPTFIKSTKVSNGRIGVLQNARV